MQWLHRRGTERLVLVAREAFGTIRFVGYPVPGGFGLLKSHHSESDYVSRAPSSTPSAEDVALAEPVRMARKVPDRRRDDEQLHPPGS